MGKSSSHHPPRSTTLCSLIAFPSRSTPLFLVLVVHAISSLPLDSIYLRFCDAHLQNLYIMVIISSYLTIYLRCSATQSLRPVISRLLPPSCLSLVSVNPWTRLVLCQIVSISMYDFLVVVVITRVSLTLRVCLPVSHLPIPVSPRLFVFDVHPALFTVVVRFLYRVNPLVGFFCFLFLVSFSLPDR